MVPIKQSVQEAAAGNRRLHYYAGCSGCSDARAAFFRILATGYLLPANFDLSNRSFGSGRETELPKAYTVHSSVVQ